MPSMPTLETWGLIRHEYEKTRRTIEDICHAYGTTPNTLRRRAREWKWTMRHPPMPKEGPPAVAPPSVDTSTLPSPVPLGELGEQPTGPREARPDDKLRCGPGLMGEREPTALAARFDSYPEPSPHIGAPIASAVDESIPIGERLQGAVARVLPAIETTLARLTAGPTHPREMELAARALGSLTRTLRELNGLLAQHQPPSAPQAGDDYDDMPEDLDEFRNELARRIEVMVAGEKAEMPARYLAAWTEAAAEAQPDSNAVL